MRKVIFGFEIVGIIISVLAWQAHDPTMGSMLAVAVGVGGYLLLGLLTWFRRRGWAILFAWAGLGYAAYLAYLEAYVLHAWTLYCVVSLCLIALIAVLSAIEIIVDVARRITGKASNMVDEAVSHLRYG